MRFRPAVDADADAWQAFLVATSSGDFLHDWAWGDVAAFDGQPQRRYLLEKEGAVVAIAAAQERSLVGGHAFWYVPHGPVLDFSAPEAGARVRALLIGLRIAAEEHRAIAVKLEPRLAMGALEEGVIRGRRLKFVPETLQVGQTRVIELADDDTLLSGFDKDTRYGVRRAEREGVAVTLVDDPDAAHAIDELHQLVGETQRRAGFPMPPLDRYRVAWRALAGAGRAAILEARREGQLLASGMVVFEGARSYYLFSGSRREGRGEPKRYASYALQWEMMRLARDRGVTHHDLWGVAPPGAGTEHAWHGVGLFKKGFGGVEVVWAGSWDLVVDPTLYRLRAATGIMRGWLGRLRG
ncbi:MAG: peptidoglycan bridge formation glycyltransferase FemA/FemB family protein [Chloroflexota bacterium]|nr:peptidoglycan bridge formation glycyltransferase FemA/FemB family protein [Chloroflexota bacterium]